MLAHRPQRCTNNKPTLGQRLVFAGIVVKQLMATLSCLLFEGPISDGRECPHRV